jgi:hypothetical protein
MAGLLVLGFLCNLFIRAVHERHHMVEDTADQRTKAVASPSRNRGGSFLSGPAALQCAKMSGSA